MQSKPAITSLHAVSKKGVKPLAALFLYPLFQALLPMFVTAFLASAPAIAAAQEDAPKGAVAYQGKLTGDEDNMNLTLEFDRNVEIDIRYMASPNRIVINLPRTVFKFPENGVPKASSFVSTLQYGAISKDHSRIVLGLSRPIKIAATQILKVGKTNQSRLTMEMVPTTSQEFDSLVKSQRELSGASGAVASKGDRVRKEKKKHGKYIIVVDPGHGGIDGGATGKKGTLEKNVTLQIAQFIRQEVEKSDRYQVMLTRDDDVFVSLKERVEFTRRNHADLFISIHADSLQQRHVRGATVYTLSKKASDTLSEKLAESENLADLVAGLAIDQTDDAVTDILVELTARETVRFSKIFSNFLTASLKQGINLIKNPQRAAAFGVLKAPEVPGILLELGYLSNIEDEKLMRSDEWRKRLADLVAKAIEKFFKNRDG